MEGQKQRSIAASRYFSISIWGWNRALIVNKKMKAQVRSSLYWKDFQSVGSSITLMERLLILMRTTLPAKFLLLLQNKQANLALAQILLV